VDPNGNIDVTGAFSGPADFGGGALTSAGVDIFLAKLSPTGGHVWSRRFGSALATHAGNGVACDGSGNVLVTGSFESSIDLGGGWATSFAHKDIFVAKYSPAGAYLWSRLAGGIYDDAGRGTAADASGQVAVTGAFQAEVSSGCLVASGRARGRGPASSSSSSRGWARACRSAAGACRRSTSPAPGGSGCCRG